MFLTFWLRNVLRATIACTFSTSEPPKVVRTPGVFNILTSKCASRHNGVHFFDIWTSKSAPRPRCFVPFHLEIVLRATTPCTFSSSQLPKLLRTPQFLTHFTSSQLPKVVRSWGVLYLFTSKSASRHNGVQLFISHLPRCLRTRRFSEPTFQPSGATKPRKNTVFRDFPTFSRTCIFFLWSFLFWLFSLLTAFSSLHIVGSLTSKLPSIIYNRLIGIPSGKRTVCYGKSTF